MHITLNVLADYELLFNVNTHDETHSIEKNRKNVFLKLNKCSLKFVQRENDIISNKLSKKKTSKIQ